MSWLSATTRWSLVLVQTVITSSIGGASGAPDGVGQNSRHSPESNTALQSGGPMHAWKLYQTAAISAALPSLLAIPWILTMR